MKMRATLIIALFLLCAVSLAAAAEDYVIGEGDLLKITVYDNPDLTFEGRVSGEGKITFPLIGELVLRGLTATEAQKKITALLEDGYVNKPQVSVFIQESKASYVYVNGEVKNPGVYKVSSGMTVLKSITVAGGFTSKAGEGRTKIIRKTAKGEVTLKASMDDLVLPDDIIYVPESMF